MGTGARTGTRRNNGQGRSATLSVCCIANVPGPFLRAALEPLREVADEVVIATGGSVPEDDLMQYAEVADRLFSLEFEFIERHLAWLHAQCRGDWILRLDGDEIPSPEMLAEVSAMRRDRSVNGVLFARRNLFPTVASYISQDPWYPDFQLRLVRNDGALRFGGTVHSGPELSLPARFVEAPIYHLPFICADVEERRNRARRYEMLSPGLIAPTCLAANRMELPESLSPLHVSLVPQADRVLIESVLSAPPGPVGTRGTQIVHVPIAVTDALWAGRTFPESAYRARIEVIGTAAPLSPAERRPFHFRVRNDGTECWGWDPSVGPFVHVVHRLMNEAGEPVEDWVPSFFTENVEPGAATIVPASVDAPAETGRYRLEVRIRHAPDRLFGRADDEVELLIRAGGAWGSEGPLPPRWTVERPRA